MERMPTPGTQADGWRGCQHNARMQMHEECASTRHMLSDGLTGCQPQARRQIAYKLTNRSMDWVPAPEKLMDGECANTQASQQKMKYTNFFCEIPQMFI